MRQGSTWPAQILTGQDEYLTSFHKAGSRASADWIGMRRTEYPPDVDTVWNFDGADLTGINRAALARIIAIRRMHPERGAARTAFVASSDLAFGMLRMFELQGSDSLQPIMVFRTAAEAERWLLDR